MLIYKALPRHVGAKVRGTMLPSLSIVFLCTNSHRRFWCDVLMEVVDWSGSLADQVVTNVACWLGHRDLALEFDADVPAVAGHHLFPARVRNIASQPRRERSHSVWSLADRPCSCVCLHIRLNFREYSACSNQISCFSWTGLCSSVVSILCGTTMLRRARCHAL